MTWNAKWNAKWHETQKMMLMLMPDLWPQAETPGVTHFGAYHRPSDGHFFLYFCQIFQIANNSVFAQDALSIDFSICLAEGECPHLPTLLFPIYFLRYKKPPTPFFLATFYNYEHCLLCFGLIILSKEARRVFPQNFDKSSLKRSSQSQRDRKVIQSSCSKSTQILT